MPSQILQVGDGGRLRISNGITDYTLIGTKETDDASNTRIVVSGFQRTSTDVSGGSIEYIATNTNGAHVFKTSGTSERMRITSVGNVGIGTSTPEAPLHIVGSVQGPTITGKMWQFGSNVIADSTFNWGFTLRTSSSIRCGGDIVLSSDERIKKNIKDVNYDSILSTFRLLKPKTYNYIDNIFNTSEEVYGFIAQEVKNIIPYSVRIHKEFIPNIYINARITFNNTHTDNCGNNFYKYTIVTSTIISFLKKEQPRIRLYGISNETYDVNVSEIISDYVITVLFNTEYKSNDIFIYGEEISDFHGLNNDAIWAVTTAALQEVDRQQQADKARIAELEKEILLQNERISRIENLLFNGNSK
jgi:hypothetical protein